MARKKTQHRPAKKSPAKIPPREAPPETRSWIAALPLLGAVAVLVFAFILSYFWNEDFWWYVASGEAIVDQGGVPDGDSFLYPEENRGQWITHSWLWTVLVALVHGGLGLAGDVAAAALVAALIVTLVFTSGRVDRFGLANALAVTAALWTLNHRLALKAELASWVLVLVFFRLLDRERPFTWRTGLALGVLQWLWSNLHGGYPLGVVTVAVYAAAGWWRRRRGRDDPGSPPLWLVAVLAVVSLATPGLAGARLRVLGSLLGLSGAVEGLPETFINEWQATFDGPWDFYSGMWVAAAVAAALGFAVSRSPRRWARLLFCGAMAVVGFEAVRFVPGFVLVSGAATLANLAAASPAPRRRLTPEAAASKAVYALACAGLGLFLVATAAGVVAARGDFEVGQSEGLAVTLSPLSTSPGAADFIRRQALPPPVMNDMFLGGWLIHELYPGYQFFIDNRNLSEKLLNDYSGFLSSPQRWQAAERRYGFRTVVLTTVFTRGVLRDVLAADPRWRLVYLDPTAVVFTRADGGGEVPVPEVRTRTAAGGVPFLGPDGALRRLGHRFLRYEPASLLATYLQTLGGLRRLPELEELADEALELRPDLGEVRWLRAMGRLARGDLAAARQDMELAIDQGVGSVEARLQYATVLHRLGQGEEALRALEEAERVAPGNPQVRQMTRQIRSELDRRP